jgi:hypothetical protein
VEKHGKDNYERQQDLEKQRKLANDHSKFYSNALDTITPLVTRFSNTSKQKTNQNKVKFIIVSYFLNIVKKRPFT